MSAPTTDPERALLGSVLHGAPQALEMVHDDDFGDPRLRVVAAIARQLTAAGVPTDPTTVQAHARATGTVTRANAVLEFSMLLIELVAECPMPAAARWYAAATLDGALRRRAAEAGSRLAQAADGESIESLLELVDAEHQAVRQLAERRAAIDVGEPRLRAVSA